MSDMITYKSHSIEAVERNLLFQKKLFSEEEERWGCGSTCPPTGQDVANDDGGGGWWVNDQGYREALEVANNPLDNLCDKHTSPLQELEHFWWKSSFDDDGDGNLNIGNDGD